MREGIRSENEEYERMSQINDRIRSMKEEYEGKKNMRNKSNQ